MDKLYIYKKIKYNLFFDFLMQVFLFAERELSIYIIKNYNVDKKYLTIFRGLNIIEEKEKIEIESSIKQELDLYRNIINIYKHGDGESYESVKRIRPDIINDIEGDIDMSFVMNTKKIKIDDLVSCIEKLLYDVEQKCKKL